MVHKLIIIADQWPIVDPSYAENSLTTIFLKTSDKNMQHCTNIGQTVWVLYCLSTRHAYILNLENHSIASFKKTTYYDIYFLKMLWSDSINNWFNDFCLQQDVGPILALR